MVPHRRATPLSLMCSVLCFTGALTMSLHTNDVPKEFFGKRTVEGTVLSTDRRLDSTRIVVKDAEYDRRIQVIQYDQNEVRAGDKITFDAVIERPEDFVTETGRLFHYEEYLLSKKISAVTRNIKIKEIRTNAKSIVRFAEAIRYTSAGLLGSVVSFPYDGVIAGMVFGYQGAIPEDVSELFRATGVLHVLVLSGYNITVVAVFLGILFIHVPIRARLGIVGIAIGMIVLVSGAGVASLRAGIMGSLGLVSVLALEKYDPLRALLVTYVLFFLWSPYSIFSDPGFHLSFLATYSMIAIIPKIKPLFYFLPDTPGVSSKEIVLLAVFMPIVLLPYTMYFSGVAPLAAFPANILFAIVTPVIMLSGVAIVCLSWISPIANMLGVVVTELMKLVIRVLELLQTLPQYNTPELGPWSVVSIYLMLFFVIFWKEGEGFIGRLRRMFLPHSSSSETRSQ